jgi:hypothetical protein
MYIRKIIGWIQCEIANSMLCIKKFCDFTKYLPSLSISILYILKI